MLATTEIMLGVTVAHAWAGGSLPSVPGLTALGLLVLGSTLLLFGDRVGLRTVVPVVLGAQIALHTVFEVAAPAAGHTAVHAHSAAAGSGHVTWQMLVAHVAGTALTVLVWAVRRRAAEVLLSLTVLCALPIPHRPAFRPSADATAPDDPLHWLTGAPRRGPPARLLCA